MFVFERFDSSGTLPKTDGNAVTTLPNVQLSGSEADAGTFVVFAEKCDRNAAASSGSRPPEAVKTEEQMIGESNDWLRPIGPQHELPEAGEAKWVEEQQDG